MAAKARSREAMSKIVVFDSSVLIDQIRSDRHLERILHLDGVVRNSSVVLAELWRGVSSAVDRKVVETFERMHPILTPTTNNWIESGQILAKIRRKHSFDPKKLRELHFDVLIALTVRAHGARLITSNRADFELIRRHRDFSLEVW
jgi:predicted nucleic acid-binding protein